MTPGSPHHRCAYAGTRFEHLLEGVRPRLVQHIRRRRAPQVAIAVEPDDVFQEIAFKAARTFEEQHGGDERAFVVWLARCAENEIRNIARRLQPKVRPRKAAGIPQQAIEYEEPERQGRHVQPGELSHHDRAQFALWSLCELKFEQRIVYTLRSHLGANWEKVAFLSCGRSAEGVRKLHERIVAAASAQRLGRAG